MIKTFIHRFVLFLWEKVSLIKRFIYNWEEGEFSYRYIFYLVCHESILEVDIGIPQQIMKIFVVLVLKVVFFSQTLLEDIVK